MAETLAASTKTCDWYDLPCAVDSFADWLFDFVLWVPRKIFEWLCDSAISAMSVFKLPDSLYQFIISGYAALSGVGLPDFGGNAAALGSILALMIYMTALGPGITMMLGSLTLRFILRRLPFIG